VMGNEENNEGLQLAFVYNAFVWSSAFGVFYAGECRDGKCVIFL